MTDRLRVRHSTHSTPFCWLHSKWRCRRNEVSYKTYLLKLGTMNSYYRLKPCGCWEISLTVLHPVCYVQRIETVARQSTGFHVPQMIVIQPFYIAYVSPVEKKWESWHPMLKGITNLRKKVKLFDTVCKTDVPSYDHQYETRWAIFICAE